ncbi:MAG: hypothetical protein HGB17_19035, partial [Syntrophobacteraceae bacterium]|nr:hypothetical protein [Syntrophobacteraceae bacterium]
GSRQMAANVETREYDFLFPAGVPAAEKIKQKLGIQRTYDVFYTPLAIASWTPIAKILEDNAMVQKRGDHLYITRMKSLLAAIAEGKRWRDLRDNQDYAIGKKILVSSTDVRTSNSAAMYLSLASYVANGEEIVSSEAQADAVMPLMSILFLKQGFQEASSAGPFEDYTTMGMGKAPLVMIYESQYIEYAAAHKGSVRGDMVLMYPEPTIFTKHIFIPLNPKAERLGELLESDPTLQNLAIEHGFRNWNLEYFREFTRAASLQLPDTLTHVIDPPRFEIIETMIGRLEREYE